MGFFDRFVGKKAEPVVYTMEHPAVEQSFAREVIHFFDGYLSLCENHSVVGTAALLGKQKEDNWTTFDLKCVLFVIDEDHADEAFEVHRRIMDKIRNEHADSILEGCRLADAWIADFYGTKDLHWAFEEVENYINSDGQTTIICKATFYNSDGRKIAPTFSVIKSELQKKWPRANIDMGENRMIVKCQ